MSAIVLSICTTFLFANVAAVIRCGHKELQVKTRIESNSDLVGEDESLPNPNLFDFFNVEADEVLNFTPKFMDSLPKYQIQQLLLKSSKLYEKNAAVKFHMIHMAKRLSLEEINILLVLFELLDESDTKYPDNFKPADILRTAKMVIKSKEARNARGYHDYPFKTVSGIKTASNSGVIERRRLRSVADSDDDSSTFSGISSTTYSSIDSKDENTWGARSIPRDSFTKSSFLLKLFEEIAPANKIQSAKYGVSAAKELTRSNAMLPDDFATILREDAITEDDYAEFKKKRSKKTGIFGLQQQDSDDSIEYSSCDTGEYSCADILSSDLNGHQKKEKSFKSAKIFIPPQHKKKVRGDVGADIEIAPDNLPTILGGNESNSKGRGVSSDDIDSVNDTIAIPHSFIQNGINTWMDDILSEREDLIASGKYLSLKGGRSGSRRRTSTPPIVPSDFSIDYFRRNSI